VKATVCDICRQPIGKGEDSVLLSVIENRSYRSPDIDKTIAGGRKALAEVTKALQDEQARPNLTRNLDLHTECYVERIGTYIDKALL